MYQEERLLSIVEYLQEHKKITVDQICSFYGVSRDTARRDLVKLEEQQSIIRTRGGGILPSHPKEVLDYQNRLEVVSDEKKLIGKKAASLISSGDRLILDASTTVQACAEFIDSPNCTIITNSINQADILSQKEDIRIHLLGGELQKEHRYLYGESVVDKLGNYHVDKAFIGVVGLSENGLTIAHEEDGIVKRKMIKQAKQVIILADHSKIGVTDFYRVADLNEIDLLITDKIPEKPFRDLLKQHSVELLVSSEGNEEEEDEND
ncbi:DeoR/GlpR family DNA-binding transcription regulator [Metabacillus arenae]|uniref:DeoR/GlpR transcriptional regulator n=1 Tax=Metabacillus arenae TaxID=2771434 RepID=A0A926N8Z9_9BACI|nr:DeoR/GlpR family DNA-binding transcription regulator [Metabacillus arenae]MBD1378914.1 DeoR/GlpR transcriptional regulator [Metabacillus arenae]